MRASLYHTLRPIKYALIISFHRCDHPHGGGRGKSKGNKHPQSPWGLNAKGKRTRKPGKKGHKTGNKMVVKERPRGRQVLARVL